MRRFDTRLIAAPRQHGVALILVMWITTLLAILLGSFALIARTENLEARHLFDTTRARYAAEAGLNLAVFQLRLPDPTTRWVADGRPNDFDYEGFRVSVSITDDSGKIDLNTADVTVLTQMFVGNGIDPAKAEQLAAAIIDWRDPDDLVTPNGAESNEYKSAGYAYEPANKPFTTVSEVQQVIGMNYEIYRRIEPAITLYTGRGTPSPAYATFESLMALPGMTADIANQLIQQRQQIPAGTPQTGLTLPDGTPIVADGGGLTYSIKSRATLPNGASTLLDATIRMGGVGNEGRPYVVLRWRDGEAS